MKIIFITAAWCPSCILMRSRLRKAIGDVKAIEVEEIDIDEDPETAKSFQPGKLLPVLIFLDAESEITRIVGETSLKTLTKAIVGVQR